MIIIHQAIYGEKAGHGLLNSSDNSDLANQISGYTDLADRPEGGVLSNSIIRGIWVDSHFLLMKTFPDLGIGIRSGRVFSHVLIISQSDIHKIADITDLFRFHLSAIDKDMILEPIQYTPFNKNTVFPLITGRQAVGVNALVNHSNYKDCIGWLDEEGYWQWVARIWAKLPKNEKENIRFGAAFDPLRIKKNELSLVYIPSERQANWSRHSFKIIGLSESEDLEGPVSEWLINESEGSILNILLTDFEPRVQSIDDLKLLYNLSKGYLNIDRVPKLNELLVFSHHISQICKNNEDGIKGKKKLFEAVLHLIPNADSSMIAALMYQSWKGFSDAAKRIEPILISWLDKNLFAEDQSSNKGSMILQAIETEKDNWWSKIIKNHLVDKFDNWKDSYSKSVWIWIENLPNLVAKHQLWLPVSLESQLISKTPKLPKETLEPVLEMVKQKEWLVLQGVILSTHFTAKEALKRQLQIDLDENNSRALEVMSQYIKGVEFIEASTLLNDNRLFQISGKLIKDNPSFKKRMNIQNRSWILIWKESIDLGCSIWEGVKHPKKVLFSIMDMLKEGKEFDGVLLKHISENVDCSLKEYSGRKNIWEKLPIPSKDGFVEITFFDCLQDLVSGKLQLIDLEPPLKNLLQSESMLQKVINAPFISNEIKIKLFGYTTSLKESHAKKILEKTLNNEAARLMGRLIKTKYWKTLAEYAYHNYSHRTDLRLVLSECSDLLGVIQRFKLKLHGIDLNNINMEDWWDLFFETAIDLYPEGPNQNGLWTNSGGTVADLHLKTNGKKAWSHAIGYLKKEGSKPTVNKLLEEMRKEFRQNDYLNTLYKTK